MSTLYQIKKSLARPYFFSETKSHNGIGTVAALLKDTSTTVESC